MKHIEIPMMGGLGNQLFQLAFGMRISSALGREVRYSFLGLEIWSRKATKRGFAIEELVKPRERSKVRKSQIPIAKVAARVHQTYWITEANFGEDSINRIRPSTKYVSGYFQREDYVAAVWVDLLRRFSEAGGLWQAIAEAPIRNEIAVHLRFGDYLNSPHVRRHHGLTQPNYYDQAIKVLQRKLGILQIRIITDDRKAAERYLDEWTLQPGTVINWCNGKSDLEDLLEIAVAAGVVCSNSTFSWWGAYVAQRQRNALIVLPTPWFADASIETAHLFPKKAILLNRDYLVS